MKYLENKGKNRVVLTLVMVLINVAFWMVLPREIGIHFSGGIVDGTVPKVAFIFMIPIIYFAYNYFTNENQKNLLVSSILFGGLDLALIFINI
ncbi:DUF1648 domain-containing protein [uncultured Clostridium sp.]|jgi:hypothetical protein|uniref:DUF1648 domain-containing protein n=1 Tax=uncultured Clostridium sp. TaxID=59620 RepID=UPI00261D6EA1|nr:DUF1648 domain-containing protein [uncultured Clostridium sp.]